MILHNSQIQPRGGQASYREVLARVAQILEAGKARARMAVEQERVRTYWEAGGEIRRHLQGKGPAFGEQVIKNMSVDLDIRERLLYDMIALRGRFQNLPPGANLTWSHYRKLIPVADDRARAYYVRRASALRWSVRELEARIRADAYTAEAAAGATTAESGDKQTPSVPRLVGKRGEPYLYRVIEKHGRLALDLGFRDYRKLPGDGCASGLRPGALVRSIKDEAGEGDYRVVPAGERRQVFAYSARVAKVIDGDTLWATIDFGFSVLADRKLRLRGIDTPELGGPEGERARDHFAATLAEAGTFVVTTTKVDLYDRYLADIFVLPGETDPSAIARQGRFVNRELLDAGVARRWTEEATPEF